ncbi:MAG TPA: TRAP transporter small permease subunit [Candidatus Tenderia sp.]|nr:TRAP transporter small permease subunit [Candidatus Tenderia sp.]
MSGLPNVIVRAAVAVEKSIEAVSEWTGRFAALLVVAMVLLVCYDVAMRYLFQAGSVALQELEWHLFGLIFLLGGAYTLKHNEHVRVDVFYQSRRMTDQRRAWIDLFGALFFLIPFCLLIIYSAWPFVANAYHYGEGSPDPGGLPHRWILKGAIIVGFVLLALQGVAMAIHSARVIFCPKCQSGECGE